MNACRKTNSQFLKDLFRVWGNEFEPLEEYKGYDQPIKVRHKQCGKILDKTPKNLITLKLGCRICKNKENGKKRRKNHDWFVNEVKKLVGNEYQVRSEYTRSKDPIKMYHTVCNKEFTTTPDAFLGSRNSNRKKGNRCPKCSGKWKRDTENFKQEVYKMYGDEFEVIGEYKGRHEKIKMLHKVCNNYLYPRPRHFLDGNSYCQYCSKKEKKDTERFKEQVYELVGGEYIVLGEYVDAKTPIPIYHKKCKTVYRVTPDNFLRGRRCGLCTDIRNSKGYKAIFNLLFENHLPFDTQYRDKNCRNIKPLPFDFVLYNNWMLEKIIAFIEFDGEQHDKPSDYFGGEEEFKKRQQNDQIKNEFAEQNGIPLIRIKYKDLENIESVLQKKLKEINIYIDINKTTAV
jgi:very-short-patch-repair endonuclease